jgi:hypothetical protein
MTDHVKLIGERSVHVTAHAAANVQLIRELGGTVAAGADTWRIDYDTEDQLAQILQRLRDADVAFAGGTSGWPPAAAAEQLRDKGKLHGPIKKISWFGPGKESMQDL